jgi:hypothetical protein
MSTLLVNGCELGLFCPSLLHQRKDDDDCIRLRLVVLLCGKTRGDDIHNHTDHPRSLHFTTTTTITRSLTVYTLLSPPIPDHSSTVRARHGDTAPGARFCLLRRPIDRERDAYSTLLLQHSTTALQYNRTVLFIGTSQARHGLTHHPPLSQHAIRG